ncbi:MAG TPA: serine hydrolase domain-containing protein [Woeseiaceae bacterium]|nr:serine hydrolase domain-containing protein [Woeseiaceae bacterium]
MRGIVQLVCCVCFVACAPSRDAGPDTLVDPARVDDVLAGYVERGELVGVSALVYEDGEEAYFGAFGLADRRTGRPMARDTLARIFSMTKPVTGVTLMTFYDEGRFGLDDPLYEYLPEYRDVQVYVSGDGDAAVLEPPRRPILVRDILRHTAGFASGGEDHYAGRRMRDARADAPENTLAELSMRLATVPLADQPGTRWWYGPSVDVQARLVEVLAGKPYIEVLETRVLQPLAMRDTVYLLRADQEGRLMDLHQRLPDGSFVRAMDPGLADFNSAEWPLTPGGWGLVSTLDDYLRFARMLLQAGELDGVRILAPGTVALMTTDALPATVQDRGWLPNKGQVGFGIDFAVRVAPPANDAEASGAVGEFFWDGLANTLFWVDPENDIAAVLFNQYLPWGQTEIMKDFRDAVYYRDPVASALVKPAAAPDAPRLSH